MNRLRYITAACYLLPIGYFLASFDLPFWGDAIASVSKPALNIYFNGLSQPWNMPDADPGHPTLFPWLIAAIWKMTGIQLWLPHLLITIFGLLTLRAVHLLSRSIADESLRGTLLVVTAISPLFVSQSVGISLQLPLVILFLWAFYFITKNKRIPALVLMCLMMLVHLQGLFLLLVLFLFEGWKYFKPKEILAFVPRAATYLFPFTVICLWLFFHYREFGWAIGTPVYPRNSSDLRIGIYNILIAGWRLNDFGYFILFIPALWWSVKRLRKGISGDIEKLFLLCLLVFGLLLPFVYSHPPNHRYFLVVYLLSGILFFKFISTIKRKNAGILTLLAVVFLVAGNFMFYPGKCLGDANLAYLSYYRAEEKAKELVGDTAVVYTYAPINNDPFFTKLNTEGLRYRDLYETDFDTIPLIFHSNVNCEFGPEVLEVLKEHFWVHSVEEKQVFIDIYINKENPAYPDLQFNNPRKPGKIEVWLAGVKRRLKPEGAE